MGEQALSRVVVMKQAYKQFEISNNNHIYSATEYGRAREEERYLPFNNQMLCIGGHLNALAAQRALSKPGRQKKKKKKKEDGQSINRAGSSSTSRRSSSRIIANSSHHLILKASKY